MKTAVLISCFDWYESRLKPISEYLSEEYDVTILTSDYNHIQKKVVEKRYDKCTYIHVKEYKKNLSLQRISSHIGFSSEIYKVLNKTNPDLIYALIPPNTLAKSCIKYKSKHENCKVIFDIIDMWPESMPLSSLKKTIPYTIWKNYRDSAIEKSDYLITECKLYVEELKDHIKTSVSVLPLFKQQGKEEMTQVLECINSINIEKKELYLGYLGSINNIIDIAMIQQIVLELKQKFDVTVKIIGDGNSVDEFLTALEESGANVEYYGKIFDESKKIEILAGCDYALNIMKSGVKVGLTIKSIDYFSYGIPLINNIKADTWKIVEENGLGINYTGIGMLDKIVVNDKSMHQRVYEFYQKNYSNEAYEKLVSRIFEKI